MAYAAAPCTVRSATPQFARLGKFKEFEIVLKLRPWRYGKSSRSPSLSGTSVTRTNTDGLQEIWQSHR